MHQLDRTEFLRSLGWELDKTEASKNETQMQNASNINDSNIYELFC